MALSAVAAILFAGVAMHELSYAASHPLRYGPAKVIAWAAGGGLLVAAAGFAAGYAIVKT